MGAVFFLGFVLIIVAIGIVPLILGIVLLAIRGDKKRRNPEKKYGGMKVWGVLFTTMGGIIVGIPTLTVLLIVGSGIVMGGVDTVLTTIEESYFGKYVDTGITIAADFEDVYEEGFAYEGKHYTVVNAMYLEYKDENRGEAVANLEKKKTVFLYENAADCDMLCIRENIFCSDEDIEKLNDYYRQGEFKYSVSFYDDKDEDIEKEIDFSDEAYFTVFDMDQEMIQEVVNEEEEGDWDDMLSFHLEQNSEDELVSRSMYIYVTPEQEVYVDVISDLFYNENVEWDAKYQIVDKETAKEFIKLGEQVEKLKEESMKE